MYAPGSELLAALLGGLFEHPEMSYRHRTLNDPRHKSTPTPLAKPLLKAGFWVLVLLLFPSPIALAGHKVAHCRPLPAEASFPPDFPIVRDAEWGYPIGGWGGSTKGLPLRHDPVIFVHGNTRDAGDWDEPGRSVKQRFLEAGYSKQELWAPSYNGKSTKENPPALQCRTDNTSNIPDLAAFVCMPSSTTRGLRKSIWLLIPWESRSYEAC